MKVRTTIVWALLLLSYGVFSQEEFFEIKPENTGQSIHLTIAHNYTDIEVIGYEGSTLKAELFSGLLSTKIKNPPITYTSDDNNISLTHSKPWTKGKKLKVMVPINTSLDIVSSFSSYVKVQNIIADVKVRASDGNIEVVNLIGNLDASTHKGDIIVENLSGSPLLSTRDGNVDVSFGELPENYPNIINTNYGQLNLYLNAEDKVNVKFKISGNFKKVKSDFHLQALDHTEFPMSKPGYPYFYRSINGGGVSVYLKTFMGKINIIKK